MKSRSTFLIYAVGLIIIVLVLVLQTSNAPDVGANRDHAAREPIQATSEAHKPSIGSQSRISSTPKRREISGLVTSELGDPIESPSIVATCSRRHFSATGSADGRFVVVCPCDDEVTFTLTASADGYVPATIRVPCDGDTGPVIVLKRVASNKGFALRIQFVGRSAQDVASARYYYGSKGAISDPQRGRALSRGLIQVDQPGATAMVVGIELAEIDIAVLVAGFSPESLVGLNLVGSSIDHPLVVRVPLDPGGAVFGDIEIDGDGDRMKGVSVGVWPSEMSAVYPNLESDWRAQSTFLSTKIKAQKVIVLEPEQDGHFHISGIQQGKYHLAVLTEDGFPLSEVKLITVNNDLVGPHRLKVFRGRTVQLAFLFEGHALKIETGIRGGPRKQRVKGIAGDTGIIEVRNIADGDYTIEPRFTYTIKPGSESYPKVIRLVTVGVLASVWGLGFEEIHLTVTDRLNPQVYDVGKGLSAYEKWSVGAGVEVVRAIEDAVQNERDLAAAVAEFGQVDTKMVAVAASFAKLRKVLMTSTEPPTPRMAAIAGFVSAGSVRSVLRAFVSPD